MREAVRRVASSASNGSAENSNFDWQQDRSCQERPARRILARSRSEAGASLGDQCDFNESHRKFSESFNESSFRQNADFDAEGWRRAGVGPGPNSHGSGAQKEGRGGRGGVGAGPEQPMPWVDCGATDVCWSRLEHHQQQASHQQQQHHQQQAASHLQPSHCMASHLPTEECNGHPADNNMVSTNSPMLL